MLNTVILMGRLCADPELRQTNTGTPVCKLRLAVARTYKKEGSKDTDFVDVTCWRNTAEFVSRYFSKGKLILVEGSLRNNDYTDKDGVKHYGMEVLAEQVHFAGDKSGGQSEQPASGQTAAGSGIGDLSEFEEILSDGEVPF